MSVTGIHHRTLLIGGVALLVLAAASFGALRMLYGERSAVVNVRWAPSVDEATQQRVERERHLARIEFREQRTWVYSLTDVSTGNIRNLVRDPAVEDTHNIDRAAFRLSSGAERGDYTTTRPVWIADLLEFVIDAALLAGAAAIVAGIYNAWRARRTPSFS